MGPDRRPDVACRPAAKASWPVRICSLAALTLVATGDLPAAETHGGVGVTIIYGADTNPLRLTGGDSHGSFSEIRIGGGFDVDFTRRVSLFLDADGEYRRHEARVSNADYGGAGGRLGLVITPRAGDPGRMAIAFGGLYGLSRSTFTDRVTGEPYEVVTDSTTIPETTVAIPDRFSSDTTGAFVDFQWRPVRPFRFTFRTQFEGTDFIEDYTETGILGALDYTALTIEPGMQYQINGMMAVTFSVILIDLDYDDQPALDTNGDEVPGSRREYFHTEYRASVLISPTSRTYLTVGLRGGDRADTYAGYYDFGARTAFVSLNQTLGRKNNLQVYGSIQDIDYDRAIVPGTIEDAIRGSEVRRLVGRYGYGLHRHVSLFVEGGLQRNDNADPIFAYERDWVLTGFEFRR